MSKRASDNVDYTGGSPKADHLCVLVHGLWGNPDHMRNIAKTLRSRHPPDELYMLLAKRNSGSFTYDGVELGGERVCAEIEDELRAIESRGGKIKKLSIIGYSLGGLVSRYAVGLLYAKGILDSVECMNFATFASPHLGVRTPLKGWHNHMWNVVGARSLSMSGRQLFTIDRFRDTNRPLLSVLADPTSIFMLGQRKFKRHTLYTNVVNDRSAVYYTTGIHKTDPYRRNLDNIRPNYIKGGAGVIMDPEYPFMPQPKVAPGATLSSATSTALRWTKRIPLMLVIALLVPIGTIAFLCNSVVQTIRSSGRIKRHEKGQASFNIDDYRVPLLIKELRSEVERAYGEINSSQNQHFLADDDDDDDEDGGMGPEEKRVMSRERRLSVAAQPTLALTPDQFEMIRSLDSLNWRKYPVWIRNDRHSHAAIIVRMEKKTFDEGWVVLRHFAEEEFLK
ncbi:putative serine esterase [Hirsutella rhossiliensis]|uniref:Serine esterase n=1 Tax=Hirsutella rhossiliensis TaxID=111463 RepID=A0A9P8MR82_9HYPO|nr:putative serine esterase [Hirsutella rhossiliensis]KAH0959602.1 putative serine esterase [Hirsutella rhossiliensis]